MSREKLPLRADFLRGAVHRSPAAALGCRRLGPEHICQQSRGLDLGALLEGPEGVVDPPVQGHEPGLGPDDFEGRVARGGVWGAQRHDATEQPRACGAEDRVAAPAGAGKRLEGPAEAFHGSGGRGAAPPAPAADALGHLRLAPLPPGGPPPRRSPWSPRARRRRTGRVARVCNTGVSAGWRAFIAASVFPCGGNPCVPPCCC